MSINEVKPETSRDVAVQVRRFSQAVVGQIHRMRGGHSKEVLDMAVGAWEGVATPDYIVELATRTLAGARAADVSARLHQDTIVHLNDFLMVARGDARVIRDARSLIDGAVASAARHTYRSAGAA